MCVTLREAHGHFMPMLMLEKPARPQASLLVHCLCEPYTSSSGLFEHEREHEHEMTIRLV